MEDTVSTVERDPLDVLAEEFFREWRAGRRPVVREFALRANVDAEHAAKFLETLLVLEDYFRQSGPTGDADWPAIAALLSIRS